MSTEPTKSEDLLKVASKSMATLAEQIEQTVTQGKAKLGELQSAVTDKTKAVAKTTDTYVHENTWKSIGVAAGIGIIIGLLIRRR